MQLERGDHSFTPSVSIGLLILVSLSIAAGRIAVVKSREGDTAFLSANDRSRWATVAALVEDGTFEIDRLQAITDPSGRRRPWQTIDRVRHQGADGIVHDYSSKPPLLSVLVAAAYGIARAFTGWTLSAEPILVPRVLLAIVNLPMLAVLLLASWRSIDRSLASPSAKKFAMAFLCFGTPLLPMTITLGNHLPAATATAVVLAIFVTFAVPRPTADFIAPLGGIDRACSDNPELMSPRALTAGCVAGLAAGFAVANDLPALSMLLAWVVLFFVHARPLLITFIPGVLVVAAAFFGTNWIAHQSLRPPYAHRSDGGVLVSLSAESGQPPPLDAILDAASKVGGLWSGVTEGGGDRFELLPTLDPDRWIVEHSQSGRRLALRRDRTGGPAINGAESRWNLHAWDHWYDYPGSYWTGERHGVDRGEPSRAKYLFHLTFGHYGIFSLAPFWIFFPLGFVLRHFDSRRGVRYHLAAAITTVSLICLIFYVSRPLIDRNYGGVSCCFRWVIWLAPLWLWVSMPAIDWMDRDRCRRGIMLALLGWSIFSIATTLESPWQHPWIYRFSSHLGWLE